MKSSRFVASVPAKHRCARIERPADSTNKIISRMYIMRIIGLDLIRTSAHKAVIMNISGKFVASVLKVVNLSFASSTGGAPIG